jgi:hypothetical protein
MLSGTDVPVSKPFVVNGQPTYYRTRGRRPSRRANVPVAANGESVLRYRVRVKW